MEQRPQLETETVRRKYSQTPYNTRVGKHLLNRTLFVPKVRSIIGKWDLMKLKGSAQLKK